MSKMLKLNNVWETIKVKSRVIEIKLKNWKSNLEKDKNNLRSSKHIQLLLKIKLESSEHSNNNLRNKLINRLHKFQLINGIQSNTSLKWLKLNMKLLVREYKYRETKLEITKWTKLHTIKHFLARKPYWKHYKFKYNHIDDFLKIWNLRNTNRQELRSKIDRNGQQSKNKTKY